jgi:isocitrate dehydrogenase
VPGYPENPQTEEEKAARAAFDAVKGSAVNPVLREGNSDRRAPASVKQFVRSHPHSMGAWSPESASHVSTMSDGDFRHSETSFTADAATTLRIEHVATDGTVTVLKPSLPSSRARSSTPPSCAEPRSTPSSPRRWPTPRSAACCSRCTSRPR